jgi:hypothetical protein
MILEHFECISYLNHYPTIDELATHITQHIRQTCHDNKRDASSITPDNTDPNKKKPKISNPAIEEDPLATIEEPLEPETNELDLRSLLFLWAYRLINR